MPAPLFEHLLGAQAAGLATLEAPLAILVPVWIVVGWLVGGAFGQAVRHLLRRDAPRSLPRPIAPLGPLAVDPPLQATTAAAFGLFAWLVPGALPLVIYSLYAAVLLSLLLVDWRTRFVYDAMVYPPIVASLVLTPLARGDPLWQGLAGALIGGACFAGIYLAGRLLYRGATPMGIGDISLAALLGGMLGQELVIAGLLLASLFGAVLAVGYWLRYRTLKTTMPYGPALCLSALAMLFITR